MFGAESALLFNSGYHANTGILPAVSDTRTLILADKLVHASLIDGIRLSSAKCIRYRHNDLAQLRRLLEENHGMYEKMIIVTESIFSMDGDEADLQALVRLKHDYSNLLLYVDEAHAFGARGEKGLGCAEEQNCINDIDFLVGTFGKAAASAGAYIVCRQTIREYLINKMRTFIFTTALPPVNIQWTAWSTETLRRFPEQKGASAANQPETERSTDRERIQLSFRQPHRADGGRSKRRYYQEGRRIATQGILCPAGTPAYSTRRDFPYPLLIDSGHHRKRNRYTYRNH